MTGTQSERYIFGCTIEQRRRVRLPCIKRNSSVTETAKPARIGNGVHSSRPLPFVHHLPPAHPRGVSPATLLSGTVAAGSSSDAKRLGEQPELQALTQCPSGQDAKPGKVSKPRAKRKRDDSHGTVMDKVRQILLQSQSRKYTLNHCSKRGSRSSTIRQVPCRERSPFLVRSRTAEAKPRQPQEPWLSAHLS